MEDGRLPGLTSSATRHSLKQFPEHCLKQGQCTVWQQDNPFHRSHVQYSKGVSDNITDKLHDGLLEREVCPISWRGNKKNMLTFKKWSLDSEIQRANSIQVERQCT